MKRFYLIGTLVLMFAQTSCRFASCRGDSEAAEYARSLSQERLQKLYFDMERFSREEATPDDGYWVGIEVGEPVPEEFKDLQAARIRPKEANIMLEGCMDEFVYLHFLGFDGSSPKSITLSYATGVYTQGSEILWKK